MAISHTVIIIFFIIINRESFLYKYMYMYRGEWGIALLIFRMGIVEFRFNIAMVIPIIDILTHAFHIFILHVLNV